MADEAYPLDHWSKWIQVVPDQVNQAVAQVARMEELPDKQLLQGGVMALPLAGAGNHSVLRLQFAGENYCLKRPRPANRHHGDPELVLRREVGGMCSLVDRVPDRCPRPLSWSTSPPWLLAQLLPGSHLGNTALTRQQLSELASAYKDLCQITPDTIDEPLWNIDWPIVFLMDWLQKQLPLLTDRGKEDASSAEAASLVSDWLASEGPASFLGASDQLVFSRGDQNMANVMWDGDRIRFVDFEYCGWNDLPRDLSLVTDHIQSYATPIEDWNVFVEQFDLTSSQRRRLQAGRQRGALSWLTKECLKPGSLRGISEENRIERLLDRARKLCRCA
ncbi:MAG: phosphotransferase [Gemmatimonadetes bacterium]|jgi:hypothetical protein|nr:phosphotransferase [Gemmatimonadota bacterium]